MRPASKLYLWRIAGGKRSNEEAPTAGTYLLPMAGMAILFT